MKKLLVALSLICFVAVQIGKAQTPAASPQPKKETTASVSTEKAAAPASTAKEAKPGCCQNASAKSCCKKGGDMKACTPEERAKCAEKMKAEASDPAKTDAIKN